MQNSYKRIDAHLSSLGYCTRSEAKKFLRIYELYVKEERVFDPSIKAYAPASLRTLKNLLL